MSLPLENVEVDAQSCMQVTAQGVGKGPSKQAVSGTRTNFLDLDHRIMIAAKGWNLWMDWHNWLVPRSSAGSLMAS
jgi:hypothetical protein